MREQERARRLRRTDLPTSLRNTAVFFSSTPCAWFLKIESESHRRLTPNPAELADDDMVEGAGEAPSAAWRLRSGLREGGARQRGARGSGTCARCEGKREGERTHLPVAISSSRETCSLAARSRSCERS